MGIYGALSTAVTGLKAQAFALENISGNIANSQTTGYKRVETTFIDMIPDVPSKQQTAGSVQAQSRATTNVQGDISSASVDTYMAISGTGFFIVEPKTGVSDGQSTFGGANYYTRRGDFEVDKEGYLVNGSGYYLKGLPIDTTTGNVSGSVPQVIQITNDFLPAKPSTRMDYALNLPQVPKNAAYDVNVPGSELLDTASFAAGGDPTVAGDGVVLASDNDTFLGQSIAGGAVTTYASNGAAVNVQLRWAKVDSVENGGADTWNLFYLSDSNATGTDAMWTNVGTDYVFGSDGSLSPAIESVTLANLTVNGTNLGNLELQHGTGGVSQFASATGLASVTTLSQNGYAAGEFVSVAVNENGRIVASYSNGRQVELAQVVTADFNSPNNLKRLDGGAYAVTSESGEPILNYNGGVVGASLEASNTDISEEFTKLIVTQQAYAAATRIVSTSNDMLQEALNMVR